MATALAVALACTVLACQLPGTILGSAAGATIDEILANPQRFAGHSVTAEGQVSRIVAGQVIALRGQASSQDVLAIVSGQSLRAVDSIDAGDMLRIVGAVRMLSRDELRQVEQQLGIALDEERLLGLAKQGPFIVARSVRK